MSTFKYPPNSGGVAGPVSSTDNAVARFDGTGGTTLQNSVLVVDDSGNVTGAANITGTGATLNGLTASKAVVTDGSKNLASSAVTATELGYVSGVTSALQTQIDAKQPLDATLTSLAAFNTNGILTQTAADTFAGRTITGTTNQVNISNGDGVAGNPTLSLPQDINSGASPAFVTTQLSGLTASTALVSDASKNVSSSAVTSTELGYVGGVTSAIQTQLNGKQASGTYIKADGTVPMAANLDLGTNKLVNVVDPTGAQDAATKSYVDAGLAALNPADAVFAATSGSNIANTYNNGASGVGAFITVTATGAFTLDGTSPALNARILIKDQTNGFENGVYNLTVVGTTGVHPVLTRALDYNTASEMNTAGLVPVINGTANALTSWQQTSTITTVGSDNLTFSEFTANPSLYVLKANNLSDVSSTSTSFNNLSPMSALGDTIYGGTSGAGTRLAGNTTTTLQALTQTGTGTVSAAPAWTSAVSTNTASTIVARDGSGNFTAGTVTAALTGTASGNTTYTANNHGIVLSSGTNAMTVVAPDASTAKTLISGGSSADPAWGTLAIGGGGTGQVTKAAAFDALQPMSASGDIIYGGTAGTGTRLAKGSDGNVLTLASGLPSWAAPAAASAAFTLQTKSTTYTAVANDYVLASASGAWTLTLPTAVGISGQTIIVKRTDDAPTNIVTINTTSAQTIDGASSVHAVTKYETWTFVSDGTNWSVASHKTGTGRLGGATITFSSTGGTQAAAGTTTTNNIDYERIGIYCRIHITLVQTGAGTLGQGATLITLPAGLVADTTIVPINTNTTTPTATTIGNCMGEIWTHNGSNIAWFSPVLHSSTKLHFAGAGNGAGELVWGDGGTASMGLNNSTLSAGGWVDVPISGWEP